MVGPHRTRALAGIGYPVTTRPWSILMAGPTELPQLISEFFDLAKEYLREHTIVPAKKLGRLLGYSLAAVFAFILASLFLSVVGMRLIVEAMPGGAIWSGLGYITSAVVLLALTGLIMWRAAK